MSFRRTDADFESAGTRCAAWLYRPDGVDDPPVVVMAHGFGGVRTWRLPAFAERFADAGFAVCCFDYRGFGDSDGRPRRVVSPSMQVRDWFAALGHVRTLDGLGDDVALWGTSFSGGHVLTVAARESVDAVVAQVPFADGLLTAANVLRAAGPGYALRALAAGVRDAVQRRAGRPYYVPLAGGGDEAAALATPDAAAGVRALLPDTGGDDEASAAAGEAAVEARVAAGAVFAVPRYRPVTEAHAVDCPVFVAQATADSLVPARSVDRLVDELDDVTRVRYPMGHFDGYAGERFETLVERERRFLCAHLGR